MEGFLTFGRVLITTPVRGSSPRWPSLAMVTTGAKAPDSNERRPSPPGVKTPGSNDRRPAPPGLDAWVRDTDRGENGRDAMAIEEPLGLETTVSMKEGYHKSG